MIYQLYKVPANNVYVLKGSIWLGIGTAARAFGCFFLFTVYWFNERKDDGSIDKP